MVYFILMRILIEHSVSKQWRTSSDPAICVLWSGFALFSDVARLIWVNDLVIAMHGVISIPDAASYDKKFNQSWKVIFFYEFIYTQQVILE